MAAEWMGELATGRRIGAKTLPRNRNRSMWFQEAKLQFWDATITESLDLKDISHHPDHAHKSTFKSTMRRSVGTRWGRSKAQQVWNAGPATPQQPPAVTALEPQSLRWEPA